MRYCGSKAKFIKELIPIITKHLDSDTTFVDAFMGGANVICSIDHPKKCGIELNKYVLALWKHIQKCNNNGKNPEEYLPVSLTKEEYLDIKQSYIDKDGRYPEWLIGYVGSALSFGGAWFNGYAAFNPKKNEDHVKEALNGISKQIKHFKHLSDTAFLNNSYNEVEFQGKCVIYCDPPYQDTKKYESDFDHSAFWEWVRKMSKLGHYVYVSEYTAPSDFKCVWRKKKKDGMGSSCTGISKTKVEKLFVYHG